MHPRKILLLYVFGIIVSFIVLTIVAMLKRYGHKSPMLSAMDHLALTGLSFFWLPLLAAVPVVAVMAMFAKTPWALAKLKKWLLDEAETIVKEEE